MNTRKSLKALASAWLIVVLAAFGPTSDPPIADAVMQGDAEQVRQLIESGEDVNAAQGDGMTALHWAAERNDLASAELLLNAGADLTAQTRIGAFTPLLVGARSGSGDVVAALLEAGADPNTKTNTAETSALHFAAASGNVRAIEALLEHGADIEAMEAASGHTPLMFAAAYNRVDAVDLLVEHGADVVRQNRVEDMAERQAEDQELRQKRNERLAAEREEDEGEPEESEAEEEAAAEEEEAPAEDEEAAAEEEDAEAEEEGEDYAAEEEEEEEPSPLSYAELVGGYGGFSAVHLAAREGNRDIVHRLLDSGADINQVSGGDHSTPLLIATINGHWDLALELLERGADPNIASEHGATPLYGVINLQWAPRAFYPQPRAQLNQDAEYLEVMEALLQAGADPNARLDRHLWYTSYNFDVLGVNFWGASPFWRAAYATDVNAMKLLVEYGADPHLATRKPASRGGGYGGGDDSDQSGLEEVPHGGPSLTPLHAASGAGYGEGYAANAHEHVPGGWMPSVKYLVEEKGLDVNARDHNGFTPLHHAAARGDVELIKYLVEQGADVTAVSRSGHTTADMANGPVQRVPPYPDAIQLLEELGAHNNDNCRSC